MNFMSTCISSENYQYICFPHLAALIPQINKLAVLYVPTAFVFPSTPNPFFSLNISQIIFEMKYTCSDINTGIHVPAMGSRFPPNKKIHYTHVKFFSPFQTYQLQNVKESAESVQMHLDC